MNVLDENIPLDQRDLLRAWGIPCRIIGLDTARLSIGDDNMLAMLHRLKQPTLFTRDEHFFKHRWADNTAHLPHRVGRLKPGADAG